MDGFRLWRDDQFDEWRQWAEVHGQSAYLASLFENPRYALTPLLERFPLLFAFQANDLERETYGNPPIAYARFEIPKGQPDYRAPLAGLPERLIPSAGVLAIWLAFAVGLYVRIGRRDPTCGVAFSFAASAIPLALVLFHLDGAETPRHVYPAAANLQIGLTVLIALCLVRKGASSGDLGDHRP